MSPTGKFTFKLVIYGAFLLYLVGDLFLWHGFLAGRMDAYLKPMPGPPGDNSARKFTANPSPPTSSPGGLRNSGSCASLPFWTWTEASGSPMNWT